MAKAQNANYSPKKYLTRKNIMISVAILLAAYLIGLFNPLTGPWFQYPYYKIGCDKDPIIAIKFKTKSYYTPDMRSYEGKERMATALYCTEEEAMEAGYQKSPAQ